MFRVEGLDDSRLYHGNMQCVHGPASLLRKLWPCSPKLKTLNAKLLNPAAAATQVACITVATSVQSFPLFGMARFHAILALSILLWQPVAGLRPASDSSEALVQVRDLMQKIRDLRYEFRQEKANASFAHLDEAVARAQANPHLLPVLLEEGQMHVAELEARAAHMKGEVTSGCWATTEMCFQNIHCEDKSCHFGCRCQQNTLINVCKCAKL